LPMRNLNQLIARCIVFTILSAACAFGQTGGTVTGQIRLPDGTPAADVRVGAMAVSLPGEPGEATVLDSIATTDDAGRYQLIGISPGRYYIVAGALAAPTFYPGKDRSSEATVLTIEAGSHAEAVDFTIQHTPSPDNPVRINPGLAGRVVMEDGGPPPFFLGTLYMQVSDGAIRPSVGEDGRKIRGSGTFVAIKSDGHFFLPVRDGEVTISLVTTTGAPLGSSDVYYVKSMTYGKTDIMGVKFRVGGASRPTITITLAIGKPK
jgi:hypothetical protein